MPIFPSLIPAGDSMKINSSTTLSAIGPSKVWAYPLPDGWVGFGSFSTGCTSDGLAARNCTTDNCEGRNCTAEDSLVATIYSISGDGYIIISDLRLWECVLTVAHLQAAKHSWRAAPVI
ncbi:hypothetical protein BT93_L3854 [Corymbia citriodora subsp. variegata]|uniref:Uncharacterized protein n=1 Tax=Corymbia citriodora subsp. variegata TaxID=360336 RepID=A0A8T0CLP8_CORYI|nr:hypothetical protein BT93_L3854 [Corymbia citriodora subsp. variegata]